MSACGAEFTHPAFTVVCRLAVHSVSDHEALLDGMGGDYDGNEGQVVARVTWPMVRKGPRRRLGLPVSDVQPESGPEGVWGAERRGELLRGIGRTR